MFSSLSVSHSLFEDGQASSGLGAGSIVCGSSLAGDLCGGSVKGCSECYSLAARAGESQRIPARFVGGTTFDSVASRITAAVFVR